MFKRISLIITLILLFGGVAEAEDLYVITDHATLWDEPYGEEFWQLKLLQKFSVIEIKDDKWALGWVDVGLNPKRDHSKTEKLKRRLRKKGLDYKITDKGKFSIKAWAWKQCLGDKETKKKVEEGKIEFKVKDGEKRLERQKKARKRPALSINDVAKTITSLGGWILGKIVYDNGIIAVYVNSSYFGLNIDEKNVFASTLYWYYEAKDGFSGLCIYDYMNGTLINCYAPELGFF